jgi:hypothetical protein
VRLAQARRIFFWLISSPLLVPYARIKGKGDDERRAREL